MDAYERYLKQLPVIPEVATKIVRIAEDKIDVSFKELESIIKVDPGLTAKILRVANSALYARQREIKSLQMAITLLGFKNIKSLVLLVSAAGLFPKYRKIPFYGRFWGHSIRTAFMAKHMVLRSHQKEMAEETFLAGLLHDIGQIAFLNADQDGYQRIIADAAAQQIPLEEFEKSVYGIHHRELGASVLQKWYFPDIYVDVAREHASQNITSSHKRVIIVVSVADFITRQMGYGVEAAEAEGMLPRLAAQADLTERDMDYYRNTYLEDLKGDSFFQECQGLFSLS